MTPHPTRLPTPFLIIFGLVNLPLSMLMPMLVLAWRYPLGRRQHGILARRLATRREMQA